MEQVARSEPKKLLTLEKLFGSEKFPTKDLPVLAEVTAPPTEHTQHKSAPGLVRTPCDAPQCRCARGCGRRHEAPPAAPHRRTIGGTDPPNVPPIPRNYYLFQ
eukprot:363764-Chlamydomonas_euryale.AAC.14